MSRARSSRRPSRLVTRHGESPLAEESDRWVMVVESDVPMQDIFREGFKRAGFRVLMTSDPHHAASRIQQNPAAADCVIVQRAVHRRAGPAACLTNWRDDEKTRQVPAMLLLDEKQRKWKPRPVTAPHRIVLPLPITMKQLRTVVDKLLLLAASK